MAPVLELDRQTASFVRQLEEQRKLEKTLLVERVRGTKEGLESVFSDIKSRVAVLEKLNGSASASCIAPIGWSKLIFTGADSVSAPNTIGFGDRDETLCKLDQIKYLLSSNSKCNTTSPDGLRCCHVKEILQTHECRRT
jgi:hypothetical protein